MKITITNNCIEASHISSSELYRALRDSLDIFWAPRMHGTCDNGNAWCTVIPIASDHEKLTAAAIRRAIKHNR
jgi:hypothetical protein